MLLRRGGFGQQTARPRSPINAGDMVVDKAGRRYTVISVSTKYARLTSVDTGGYYLEDKRNLTVVPPEPLSEDTNKEQSHQSPNEEFEK